VGLERTQKKIEAAYPKPPKIAIVRNWDLPFAASDIELIGSRLSTWRRL